MTEFYPNNLYRALPTQIDLDEFTAAMLRNEVCVPFDDAFWHETPVSFPLCFIPLFPQNGMLSYVGILKHWLLDRPMAFFVMNPTDGYYCYEVARSVEQFVIRIVIDAFELEDEITAPIDAFANRANLSIDLDKLFQRWFEIGNRVYGELPQFIDQQPALNSFLPGFAYNGRAFNAAAPPEALRQMAGIEVESEISDVAIPIWFSTGDRMAQFSKSMQEGDLESSWMQLNSRGWKWEDLRQAASDFAAEAADPTVSAIVEAWSKVAQEDFGNTVF